MRPLRSRHAFSLIELLVVIAISGTLLAMALPSLGRARAGAGATRCLAQLRSLGQLTNLYADDHRDLMPRSQHSAFSHHASPWGYAFFEHFAGEPYQPGHAAWDSVFNGHLRCPLDRRSVGWSYGFNVYFELTASETLGPTWNRRASAPFPSRTVLFGELLPSTSADHAMPHFWVQFAAPPEIDPARHGSGTGAVFLDAHASTLPFQRLFDLDSSIDLFNPASAH